MKKFVEEFGPSLRLPSMNRIVGILRNLSDPSIEHYMKQINTIDKAACSWLSLISGINFNVFKGFSTEKDLVEYFLRRAYHDNYTVLASVVFTNVNQTDRELPPNTIYKIRQNASLTPSTKRLRDRFWVPAPARNGFLYYDFAFSWIQEVIDRAIIDTHVGRSVVEPGLFFQEMPYPCYTYDKSVLLAPLSLNYSPSRLVSFKWFNMLYRSVWRSLGSMPLPCWLKVLSTRKKFDWKKWWKSWDWVMVSIGLLGFWPSLVKRP